MEKTNQEIIFELMLEFKNHRDAIMVMISDLEQIKQDVDRIIPKKLDARYARFFEEKIKSVTELFKTLLEMRKEIQKSLKEEIELRRKINVNDSEKDIDDIIDIRGLAAKVQDFQEERIKMRTKTLKKAQRETDEIASEIVTIQESG
jgi:hypothetical protein